MTRESYYPKEHAGEQAEVPKLVFQVPVESIPLAKPEEIIVKFPLSTTHRNGPETATKNTNGVVDNKVARVRRHQMRRQHPSGKKNRTK